MRLFLRLFCIKTWCKFDWKTQKSRSEWTREFQSGEFWKTFASSEREPMKLLRKPEIDGTNGKKWKSSKGRQTHFHCGLRTLKFGANQSLALNLSKGHRESCWAVAAHTRTCLVGLIECRVHRPTAIGRFAIWSVSEPEIQGESKNSRVRFGVEPTAEPIGRKSLHSKSNAASRTLFESFPRATNSANRSRKRTPWKGSSCSNCHPGTY